MSLFMFQCDKCHEHGSEHDAFAHCVECLDQCCPNCCIGYDEESGRATCKDCALFDHGYPVTQRILSRSSGSEGPRDDPYGYRELTVQLNGWDFTLHDGFSTSFRINDVEISDDEGEAISLWQAASRMSVAQFEKAYERVHPYYYDPMGHPSMHE